MTDVGPELPSPNSHPRLAYLGTPALAVAPLDALVAAGHDVALVVSAADKRRGRGSELSASPVKARALELGIEVSDDPDSLLGDVPGIDLAVVVAYGRLIRPHLLAAVPFVNLHVSLLPRWRGAAPIERAILAGDLTTGVCVMEITEGLDEGAVFARSETPIGDKTVDELRHELVSEGTRLLLECLDTGFGAAVAQRGDVTYATKLTADDRRIEWSQAATQIARVIRIGGAFTTSGGKRLKVQRGRVVDFSTESSTALAAGEVRVDDGRVIVGCGNGALALETVQVEGKASIEALTWWRNAGLNSADRLGS